MSFFGDIFGSIKDVGGSLFGTVKDLGGSVFGGIKDITAPIFGAVGGLLNRAGGLVNKNLDRLDSVADSATNAIGGLGSFLSSPLMWVGLGLAAVIILPKVLDKI